jgi:Zn-dependent protease/predicted transcriptional regulator
MHELAHSLVAKANKIRVKRITLFLFGGMSELFEEPQDAEAEFKIALSGPATSVFLALIFLIAWRLLDRFTSYTPAITVVSALFQINMILAIFNLLPGFPLDGGRVVRSIAWALSRDLRAATRIATSLGQVVAFFIILFGILQIIILGMWTGLWLILIGLFLLQSAGQSYLELQIREALGNMTVESLMNPNVLTLHPNLSINDALAEYFIKYASQSFPVVEDNEVVGLISLHDIRANIEYMRDDARVGEIMRTFPKQVFMKPKNKVLDALKIMIEEDLAFLPIKKDRHIVGMITLESIASFLAEEKII